MDDEIVAEQRYKFIIEEKDHQRTAALRAEMVDYRSDDVPLTPLLQQRLETRALNAVISEFDYRYRQLKVELRQRKGSFLWIWVLTTKAMRHWSQSKLTMSCLNALQVSGAAAIHHCRGRCRFRANHCRLHQARSQRLGLYLGRGSHAAAA